MVLNGVLYEWKGINTLENCIQRLPVSSRSQDWHFLVERCVELVSTIRVALVPEDGSSIDSKKFALTIPFGRPLRDLSCLMQSPILVTLEVMY